MPRYAWTCYCCDESNPANTEVCIQCGFSATATSREIDAARRSRAANKSNHDGLSLEPDQQGIGEAPFPTQAIKRITLDGSKKFAAKLHIAVGTLALMAIVVLGLLAVGLDITPRGGGSFFSQNMVFPCAVYTLLAVAEVFTGLAYLRGSIAAKFWLVGASVLMLPLFPIGTAIGAYSMWALLGKNNGGNRPEF